VAIKLIHCDLRIQNCTVEVRVNQIPVVHLNATKERTQSRPVVEFLVSGKNTLEMVVNPGATPSRALDASAVADSIPGSRVLAALTEYEEGEYPFRGGRTLARIEYDAGNGAPPKALLLSSDPITLTSSHAWAWQSAAINSLDSATMTALTQMLHTMHQALSAHHAAPILDLMRVYYNEYALAYPGQTVDQLLQDVSDSISTNSSKWNVAPLDPAQFDFRLCAGGRLVECIDHAWNPVIRADVGEDLPYDFPIMAGLYQGRWQVLR
jgi:hypothetical protein